jgi:hypothetical protein
MLALALLVLAADGGVPEEKVTAKNWETHPRVVPARLAVVEATALENGQSLTRRDAHDCTQDFSTLAWWTDPRSGVVRKLVREFGSEDSSHHVEAWYDAQGRQRFVFAKVGAVPSAWIEARWWLDEQGRVTWHTRKTGGEGPSYYANDLSEYLVKDPARWVAERTACDAG